MSIDTKIIIKLRELTGAGVGDCKEALEEASGDLDKAVEVLRKKGAVKAAKKSERQTNEGVISFAKDHSKVAVVGLACETDFVSRNEDFIKTVDEFSQKLLEVGQAELKSWAESKIKDELVVKIGENIQLAVNDIIEGDVIGTYLHSNKKIASAVVLSEGDEELAVELAMQVAAMSPKYIQPEDIPAAEIEKEKEVYRAQLKTENKPEAMWEKIILGKLNKYYQEVCLVKQPFIKEDKKSVEQLVKEKGGNIKIIKFTRYQI